MVGSGALESCGALRLSHLQVPIATEYHTDEGDVIGRVHRRREVRDENLPSL